MRAFPYWESKRFDSGWPILFEPPGWQIVCAYPNLAYSDVSVKVVCHRNGNYFCGGLWKTVGVGVPGKKSPDVIVCGAHASKIAKRGAA